MRCLTTLIICFCVASLVFAQEHSPAIHELPQDSRSAVVTENPWTHLPTVDVENGRVDEELEILRAAYDLDPDMKPEATPEATVRTWLEMEGDTFGIGMPELLELVREMETVGAQHLTFQQTLGGVKVYGRFVHVNLDQSGLPVMATSGYAPHLEELDAFDPVPSLSVAQAESLAQQAVSTDGATSDSPELMVLPDDPPRLVWRVIVWPDSYPAEWEVLLDANTGELIQLIDLRSFARLHAPVSGKKEEHDKTGERSETSYERADGEGYVWLFDPLTASGHSYGGDYADNNDQDNATLNSLLKTVTLRDIERGSDGLYRLKGPWVEITASAAVERNPTDFKYTRADDRFEAVMAYYFIDENERYIQSLDTGYPAPESPVKVNPHVVSGNNSFFQDRGNFIGFGSGGIDDAEDAGVILHEYGHAVMYHHLGFLSFNAEQRVLCEGFADYWAVSYRRHLMESGQVPKKDWRDVFPWDGITWGGRRADGNENYDAIQNACRSNKCDYYYHGTTWAALMMELWGKIKRENADRLHLAAFLYLGPYYTLRDMAEALLKADEVLYKERYSSDIVSVFQPKGFLPLRPSTPTLTQIPDDSSATEVDPIGKNFPLIGRGSLLLILVTLILLLLVLKRRRDIESELTGTDQRVHGGNREPVTERVAFPDILLSGSSRDNQKVHIKISGEKLAKSDTGVILGRSPKHADFVITGDSVSRRHASVRLVENKVVIRDLKSLNGTTVNGVNLVVGENHPLSQGSKIVIGRVELEMTILK